jgi:hypothetical protein
MIGSVSASGDWCYLLRNRVRYDAYRAFSSRYARTCGTVAELSAYRARLMAGACRRSSKRSYQERPGGS